MSGWRSWRPVNKQQSEGNVRWRSAAPGDTAWVGWGHDHIAYHRPSGKTHFLNASSKRLITELLCEPTDLASIVEAFGVVEGDSEWQAQTDEMHSMLDRLEQLGLVERL